MRAITIRVLILSALAFVAFASPVASAAATPAQIADKALVKMRALSVAALRSLDNQEKQTLKRLRAVAARGESVEIRRGIVLKRSVKLAPIAETACRKIIQVRDKALGRIVTLEGTASIADITAARNSLRTARDTLHDAIGDRADQVGENMALAATLDPGDRDEVDTLTPNVASPSCDVEAP